ncbi:MAG: T9SS type A sorting domain-containing protein [Candidatus Electryonea clarkiae]|nr:T9SS type A sorting domain-containing protein [Candidatus Electryonea clarkiae]MDP8287390.1 T9SS type A sorting domain-containing protein [Candidatus Electryonea clarkiae]
MNKVTRLVQLAMLGLLAVCIISAGAFARPLDKTNLGSNSQSSAKNTELNRVPIKHSSESRVNKNHELDDGELDELVWQEDFENIGMEWVISDASDIYWQTSDYSQLNGDNWRCYDPDAGVNGGYDNHWLHYLVSPLIDLGDSESPVLSFDCRVMVEVLSPIGHYDGWDGANVWASGDAGQTWDVLIPATGPEYNFDAGFAFSDTLEEGWGIGDNVPGWGDILIDEWSAVTMDMSDYAGGNMVRIAFCFASDQASSTNDGLGDASWTGFQLDNIELSERNEIYFADDADGNNTGGEFVMFSGRYPAFSLHAIEDAPSGDLVSGIYNIPREFSRYATYTEDIDLTDYDEGLTYLDVMVNGVWEHANDDAYWTMHVKPSDTDEWYYASNPYGEDGEDEVYDDVPEDWEWFSTEWEELWDLTAYQGETIQVRIEFTSTSILYTADEWHIYFDDLSVIHQNPPETFDLVSPEDGAEVNTASPTLEWDPAEDPDEDSLSYVLYYALEEDFAEADSVTDIDTIEYTFDEDELLVLIDRQRERLTSEELDEFDDDVTVYWKVRANDGFTVGIWSSPDAGWSFGVYLFDPPDGLRLSRPSDGVEIDTLNWTFTWYPAVDPDPGDEITYTWYLSVNEDLSDSLIEEAGADTFLEYTGLDDDTQYYWNVHAQDTNTEGAWANSRSFQTNYPEPPNDFALLTPENEATLDIEEPFEIAFTWDEAVDPDPEQAAEYSLFIYVTVADLDTTINMAVNDNLERTISLSDELEIEGLEGVLTAEWWVVALSSGDEVESMERFTFLLDITGVEENAFIGIPTEFSIASVYPNPFNPTVSIMVGLPFSSRLTVSAYDILGREIAILTNDNYTEGYHRISFDGSHLSSGIYFIRATVPGKMNEIRKVVLSR